MSIIGAVLGLLPHLAISLVVVIHYGLGSHVCTQVMWTLALSFGLFTTASLYNWGAGTGEEAEKGHYASTEYWDERYKSHPELFEWYETYETLRGLLTRVLPKGGGRILEVGCGNSELALRLRMDGYTDVLGVDVSPAVVEQMQRRHGGAAGVAFEVGDVRDLRGHGDDSFAGAVDKGTLDALLCGTPTSGTCMLAECHRLLRPGAALVCITNGAPKARLPFLTQLPWRDVEVFVAPDAELNSLRKKEVVGPLDPEAALAKDLPTGGDTHYIYTCFK